MGIKNKIFRIENGTNGYHNCLWLLGLKIKYNKGKSLSERIDFFVKKFNIVENINNRITANIIGANIIKEAHSKTFPQFKNCNAGKEIVLVASGPTMAYYNPLNDVLHLGVNKVYKNKNINLDYLFAMDYSIGEETIQNIVNYEGAKIFLGSFITDTADSWLSKYVIPLKYYNKDNVYKYYSEYPAKYGYPDIECCGLMDFGSVIFCAAQFALYTGVKKIYLVGCDCSSGYFDGTKNNVQGAQFLIKGWKKFKIYAQTYYPDVEIVSINPVGLRGLFKDVYTKEFAEKINLNVNSDGYTILEENDKVCVE